MGTKRKSSEEAVKKTAKPSAAKLPPKRKVASRPAAAAAEVVEKPKAAAKPRKAAVTEKTAATPAATVKKLATEEIALRAYFISQKRAAEGRAGDSLTDWLEAEQQLLAEK